MTVDKSRQNNAFFNLDERRQKAIVLLFEDELTDEEIAKSVNRSRATLSKWKKDESFKEAMIEYRRVAVDDFVPEAIKELRSLALRSRSDMVKFQAIMAVLNLSGFGNTDESPEITQAKTRKLTAEANAAEFKAKILENAADKLEGNVKNNKLLQALANPELATKIEDDLT
ncbi:phBC6A51 family helix-turn-helix protein [Lactococcus formosensis]|uniref:phBC6A51 family helix-turn-helix protein n=1 Tax=Lactococcus formosensis TaxID=1281486 RepID=UPI00288CBD52|nr:phBC6A51 family helix-turn-helix protein [Lactococcus formosensis]MDT2726510.1 phBC6A51 family helix-turn-helix protein [Lactococcus formosensis]